MTLQIILFVVFLCLFVLTAVTWIRLFAWVFSLITAGARAAAQQPVHVRVGSLGSSGVFQVLTEKGRGGQRWGFVKAFLWAAGSFVANMVLALVLVAPQLEECMPRFDALETNVFQRVQCAWLFWNVER
ncbi:hypothetical protein [uncultured Tateyamaria sp.]|uniref:hypothetical protein n=1 Tax=uncultured Tateyamaria sp. TaxID=455651 RepID=UPI00263209D2|nr:hypothetical protein [uncultured Tateyamaria sp.]